VPYRLEWFPDQVGLRIHAGDGLFAVLATDLALRLCVTVGRHANLGHNFASIGVRRARVLKVSMATRASCSSRDAALRIRNSDGKRGDQLTGLKSILVTVWSPQLGDLTDSTTRS
jgi:hypothetical protein